MAKLKSQKQKKSWFYKEKSLVGLLQGCIFGTSDANQLTIITRNCLNWLKVSVVDIILI
jgi:hypothetical protein